MHDPIFAPKIIFSYFFRFYLDKQKISTIFVRNNDINHDIMILLTQKQYQ